MTEKQGLSRERGHSMFSRVLAAIVTADAFDWYMREQSIFERT